MKLLYLPIKQCTISTVLKLFARNYSLKKIKSKSKQKDFLKYYCGELFASNVYRKHENNF